MAIQKPLIEKSEFKLRLEKKIKEEAGLKGNFRVSFEDFDSSQKFGSSFADWQKCGWLSHMLDVIKGYCKRPLREQIDGKKFVSYGSFPPKEKTEFNCPSYLSEDLEWGRIHLSGKIIVAGHIIGNTFYIVFLDKSHKFWDITK